jgi:hypothetical protein
MTVANVPNGTSGSLVGLSEVERVNLLAAKLRNTLRTSMVLTPDSEGYAKSIQRWSDAVEMQAVSYIDSAEPIWSSANLKPWLLILDARESLFMSNRARKYPPS